MMVGMAGASQQRERAYPPSASDPRSGPAGDPRPALPEPPYLVAGLGRAGQAAVAALSDVVGAELVSAWDADTGREMQRLRRRLERAGVRTYLTPHLTRRQVGLARTIVKSPGIPFNAQVIDRALGKRRLVIDELELGWRLTRVPVLGVTGTNGKSTVCGLTNTVLAAAGRRVALAGNTDFGQPLSAVGMPARDRAPLDWIVCEVSSFQLEGCATFLPDVAVFTNLTPEHLGRHGTLDRYGLTKRRMFITSKRCASRAIVDVDTAFGADLAREIERCGGRVRRVGASIGAQYRVLATSWGLRRADTVIDTPSGTAAIRSSLPGVYNARNLAAALAAADELGIERAVSLPALAAYPGTPGRFEHIDEGQPFAVVVDFAHSPDGMEQFLLTVRAGMDPADRLIVVFGLGGAPGTNMYRLGRVTASLSDRLVLTTSGFRGQPPIPTLECILAGARHVRPDVDVVLDRYRAFEHGIGLASAGDVVVIPGRGALTHMQSDPHGKVRVFDDRAVAREILRASFPAPSTASAGNPPVTAMHGRPFPSR